jgi:hypothetical protein
MKGKGKRLVNKDGCIHIYDIDSKKFVKLRGKNLKEAVEHVDMEDRKALDGRGRKDIIRNFKLLTDA